MIKEISITPQAIMSERFEYLYNANICGQLTRYVISNLHKGDWSAFITQQYLTGACGLHIEKILILLSKYLRQSPQYSEDLPTNEDGWFKEAANLISHQDYKPGVIGIITSEEFVPAQEYICHHSTLDGLNNCKWYDPENEISVMLNRNIEDYLKNLKLLFGLAKNIQIVDPYIDPKLPNYYRTPKIFELMHAYPRQPIVCIHRSNRWSEGPGRPNQTKNAAFFKDRFQAVTDILKSKRIKASLYIWDKDYIPDRYILTEMMGIQMGHDLDEVLSQTTWTRLSPKVTERIRNHYDPTKIHHMINALLAMNNKYRIEINNNDIYRERNKLIRLLYYT